MSGIRQDAVFAVTRINTIFSDEAGIKVKHGAGTAFWVESGKGLKLLVTNRHLVEPTIKFPDQPDLRTHTIEVELRRREDWGSGYENTKLCPETRFFKVDEIKSRILYVDNADCAIILPHFIDADDDYCAANVFYEKDLADEFYFLNVLKTSDYASFIGFAGKRQMFWGDDKSEWWDQDWRLPIVRPAFIASYPGFQFHHKEIPFADVLLVSGLSFSGSSGSPVLAHQKYIAADGPPNISVFEGKLIGIMSGHWWGENSNQVPPMFRDYRQHSGLSYFTRSTSIRHLIAYNGL